MKKIICNQNTVDLAQKQMFLAFRKTYLLLQEYLLNCLEWAGKNPEKKREIKAQIFKVGQVYEETCEIYKK